MHRIETKNGASYSGFVVHADASELILQSEEGEHRLARRSIATDQKLAQSAMPEGLLNRLTAQEVADLVAYLSQAR